MVTPRDIADRRHAARRVRKPYDTYRSLVLQVAELVADAYVWSDGSVHVTLPPELARELRRLVTR